MLSSDSRHGSAIVVTVDQYGSISHEESINPAESTGELITLIESSLDILGTEHHEVLCN